MMIQANCRARFTADDFDLVAKCLATSERNAVGLSALLSDEETRDEILDHPAVLRAVLDSASHLTISPQFYFFVLTRHVLKETGIDDRKLADYIASLLEAFSRTARMRSPSGDASNPVDYISDLLLALRGASGTRAFLIRAHVGNYALFLTGVFHENVERRRRHGAPGIPFYENMGRSSFREAARHPIARDRDIAATLENLADQFHEVRLALNQLSDRLINLDEPVSAPLFA